MINLMPHYQSTNTILSFFFFFQKHSIKKICMHNSNEHAVKLIRRLEILDLIKSNVLKR